LLRINLSFKARVGRMRGWRLFAEQRVRRNSGWPLGTVTRRF